MTTGVPFSLPTLPANTVVGRLAASAGQAEAITFAQLAAQLVLSPVGSSLISYTNSNTGGQTRTLQSKLMDCVSVLDFIPSTLYAAIAAGTDTTDLSAYVLAAINTLKAVYFPAGTYHFNVTTANNFIAFGDGTVVTHLKPYDFTKAVIVHQPQPNTANSWAYHTTLTGLDFAGAGGTLVTDGVGFTVGHTDPTVYTANDAFIGFVTFNNCRFTGLYKGVQRPSGNLAFQFYNCNFASNYYGTYSVQGKGIPPGQMFVYNGESDSNICAHFGDVQDDNLGQWMFDGHVFESNSICVRVKQPVAKTLYSPLMFRNCWNEANGLYRSGGPSTVTLDKWSGTGPGATLTTESVSCTYPYILQVDHMYWEGGFCAGINNAGGAGFANIFHVVGARVEQAAGTNSSPFLIDSNASAILFDKCVSAGGFGNTQINCREVGRNRLIDTGLTAPGAAARCRHLPQIQSLVSGTVQTGISQTFAGGTVDMHDDTNSVTHTGSVVTDGVIYSAANRYNFTTATGNVFYTYAASTFTTNASSYVAVTFQARVTTAGTLSFYVWDGSNYVFVKAALQAQDANWHTYGGIVFCQSPISIHFGALTQDPSPVLLDIRLSAYQAKQFTVLVDAEDWLFSRVYQP